MNFELELKLLCDGKVNGSWNQEIGTDSNTGFTMRTHDKAVNTTGAQID